MLQKHLFFFRWIVQIQQHLVLVLLVPGPIRIEVRDVEGVHKAGEFKSLLMDCSLLVGVGVPLDWKKALFAACLDLRCHLFCFLVSTGEFGVLVGQFLPVALLQSF